MLCLFRMPSTDEELGEASQSSRIAAWILISSLIYLDQLHAARRKITHQNAYTLYESRNCDKTEDGDTEHDHRNTSTAKNATALLVYRGTSDATVAYEPFSRRKDLINDKMQKNEANLCATSPPPLIRSGSQSKAHLCAILTGKLNLVLHRRPWEGKACTCNRGCPNLQVHGQSD